MLVSTSVRVVLFDRQLEAGGLFAIPDQQTVAVQRWVVPGFPFEWRKTRHFTEFNRRGIDECYVAEFHLDEQMIADPQNLAVTVSASSPNETPGRQFDTLQNPIRQAINVILVNDDVAELRLQDPLVARYFAP